VIHRHATARFNTLRTKTTKETNMNVEKDTRKAQPSQQEIAMAAYYLWEKEGYVPGRDTDYWQRAEAQLMATRTCGKATGCKPATSTNIATAAAQSLCEGRQSSRKSARGNRRQTATLMV
jgi:hypothetical protein